MNGLLRFVLFIRLKTLSRNMMVFFFDGVSKSFNFYANIHKISEFYAGWIKKSRPLATFAGERLGCGAHPNYFIINEVYSSINAKSL